MTVSSIKIWLATTVVCVSAIHANPAVAEPLESESLTQAKFDRLFADNAPWIQQMSCKSTATSSCGQICDSCGESCGGCCSGCCDDLMTRASLTNGLWGAGAKMAEHGVVADLQWTQWYQGVTNGGVNEAFRYGGKADYNLTFVGEKLGLNKGFNVMMHAETRYGQTSNLDAGALALPNINMLYPAPGRDVTSITGLFFMQALSEKWAVTAGKYNSLDLFNMLYPNTGRGIDGFMNASMVLPLGLLRTTNLSINGAGIMGLDGQQVNSALLVYDTNNSSTTAGVNNLFDQGAVVLGYYRIPTKSGSHGFVANWSSRTYTSTNPLSWTVIPGQGVVAGQESGSWSAVYFLDHMLWADQCNPARKVNLFSMWSLADQDTSPYHWTATVALEGNGLIQSRESDKAGVGYFYNGLSGGFKDIVNVLPGIQIQDVQGFEVYYNAEVTPWFHLTLDLQAVDNQNVSNDTAFILGLRGNIRI